MNTISHGIKRVIHTSAQAPDRELQAVWNGAVLARSDRTVVIEGNHYFPPDEVKFDYLELSAKRTTCRWKGLASYYEIVVDGERERVAAWYYPQPSPAASEIKDHVAFWNGATVGPSPRA